VKYFEFSIDMAATDNTLTSDDDIIDMTLEPVLVLARLSQVSLQPVGTKLYIRDGMVQIHSTGIMQPIVRWMGGDSREDLTYLFEPIRKFTEIYQKRATREQKTLMKQLIEHAVSGIEKLRETYGSYKIVDHSLAYYQTFLIHCGKLSIKSSAVKRSPYMEGIDSPIEIPPLPLEDDEAYTEREMSKIAGIWSMEDLRMVCSIIHEIDSSANQDQRDARMKTLESFLNTKEVDIRRAIRENQRP
tara:strand:+ start:3091 stop:3822 length:732 start_codon:yes stop_codon:yes gene_type:complete